MPAFPDYLTMETSSFSQQDTSIIERSDVERGPAMTRRSATDPMITDTATIFFRERWMVAAFRAWLYSATGANAGAAWVDWTDPRTGGVRSIRFVTLGALTPLSGQFAIAQMAVTFEYLETVEQIAADAPRRWDFTTDIENWRSEGATLTWQSSGAVRVTAVNDDPNFISPSPLNLLGAAYSKVRLSITRIAGSSWDGVLFFGTTAATYEGAFFGSGIADPLLAVGASAVLEIDLAGVPQWVSANIFQIRLDFGRTADDVFDVDWVEIF